MIHSYDTYTLNKLQPEAVTFLVWQEKNLLLAVIVPGKKLFNLDSFCCPESFSIAAHLLAFILD